MKHVVVDGVQLVYEEDGFGEPVVFIHGVLISDAFRPLLGERVLTDRYRLVSYHRRGYRDDDKQPQAEPGLGQLPEETGQVERTEELRPGQPGPPNGHDDRHPPGQQGGEEGAAQDQETAENGRGVGPGP